MSSFFIAFAVSLCATLFVIRAASRFGQSSLDHDISGPQKFHARPVPRIGGIGIVAGLVAAALGTAWSDLSALRPSLLLLICGLPALAAGLIEDYTKRVSPAKRLAATAVSAALGIWLLDAVITRADIPGIDWLVAFGFGAAVVTIVAVAGIANSINIIDGFNGLASMCSILMLMSLAYVAFEVGDHTVALLALAGIGGVLGFFVWNFPAGLIFLGDGGAYFLGFYIAEVAILLLARNPSVSPLFPLLVVIYPVFETLFSIYRRRVLRALPPSMPDGIHLHSLIYRRVIRWAIGGRGARSMTRRNSMTSPYLWALCMMSVVPAVVFWSNSGMLSVALLLFVIAYVTLYWRIVRFKSPRWLRIGHVEAGWTVKADNRQI
ncbi:MAG: glycosyltransferase [Burkholderiales bacterium]|nr:glycosyltransferase [Burkholderiales bacterium]MDE1925923.1 glycosyltransferase family 4 protein [Burkholderiales bacterium]